MTFQNILPALLEGVPIRKSKFVIMVMTNDKLRELDTYFRTNSIGLITARDILSSEWEPFRYVDFKDEVYKGIESFHREWREGQKVFNYIEATYNRVARVVQFKGIDCYHVDANIEMFLKECYNYLINIKEDEK